MLGGRLRFLVKGPALAVAWMSGSDMALDRDLAAFGERAQHYDEGWLGELHHQIADRTADLALTCVRAPRRILDVGCGTEELLARLAARAPQAEALAGIDAAPAIIRAAQGRAIDGRLRFVVGTAGAAALARSHLRPGDQHDLVRSLGGPAGRASAVRPGPGRPAAALSRLTCSRCCCCRPWWLDGGARRAQSAGQLNWYAAAGLHSPHRHRLYAAIIQARRLHGYQIATASRALT